MGDTRKPSVEALKTRREFIQDMACATGVITTGISGPAFARETGSSRKVTLFALSDASDNTLQQPPIRWALGQLQKCCRREGLWRRSSIISNGSTSQVNVSLSPLVNRDWHIGSPVTLA